MQKSFGGKALFISTCCSGTFVPLKCTYMSTPSAALAPVIDANPQSNALESSLGTVPASPSSTAFMTVAPTQKFKG
ncbi:hypothetical protein LshimejAT787_0111870 [Lyophyllum shimeji]|uniref:Uncharacterized protein n=1 Tax=Lyophyllum shimeji TaxID=47721 RepID=A0A9P3PEA4_LYOSH|nr:hypothetical protein LshimejAT787_0111870 [Lyophyllum shimeji]